MNLNAKIKPHLYKVNQRVLIVSQNKETKIEFIIQDIEGGYTVNPPIQCGEASCRSWNEDDMLPIGLII